VPALIITFIVAIASGVFITTGLDKLSTLPLQPSQETQVEQNTYHRSTPTPKPSPSAKPSIQPQVQQINAQKLITCTGPDGKQFQTSQKDCDEFNAAWKNNPTVTINPTNKPNNSDYNYDVPKFETVDCVLSYGTYKLSPEYCESSKKRDIENQQIFADLKESANHNLTETNELNNQKTIDFTYENSRCKQESLEDFKQEKSSVTNKFASLNTIDSSAYQTAIKILERDLNQALGDCDHYFPID